MLLFESTVLLGTLVVHVQGNGWRMGGINQNCDTVCAGIGKVCRESGLFAAQVYNNAGVCSVASQVGYSCSTTGGPYTSSPHTGVCPWYTNGGWGYCAYQAQSKFSCGASFWGVHASSARRACYCNTASSCSSPSTGHGGSQSITRYAASSVNAPASCSSQTRTRSCSDGSWSSYSGSYSHTSCTVYAQCSSPTTSHGGQQCRTMYESSSVTSPATCVSGEICRTCNNGAWPAWSGWSEPSCNVDCASPSTAHGESQSRTMYQSATATPPATCVSETQTSTCTQGAWGDWSGSYTHSACTVGCTNPNTADGGSDSQVRYESASVNAPASCQSETQSRTCGNGVWSSWSGSYTNAACTVQARCSAPDTVNGESESRTSYQSSSVNYPASCQSETQSRTCNNGAWSSWSGSPGYSLSSCTVIGEACTSPATVHAGSVSRVVYETASVNAPASCQSETQSKSCIDGSWSSWSGSYPNNPACTVKARCSNPDTEHEGLESATRFEAASVNAPASCNSETQSRACNDGSWSSWSGPSGSYTNAACTVQARCSAPDTVNGGSESRVRYESASVQFPATCKSETQTRDCSNGAWSSWSGSYSATACAVYVPCSNPAGDHGESQSRVRYESAAVSEPATCQVQVQTRQCNNGAWSGWSGAYGEPTCTVYESCSGSSHGASMSRTRYQASSVNAPTSCESEEQTSQCNNGAWGAWSGSYSHSSCKVNARCSGPDGVHGASASQTAYQMAVVSAPAACTSENQIQTCNDGVWSAWSGSYTNAACIVQARCSNPDTAHGGSDGRVTYESASENAPASCHSESQIRTCNDGSWSSWSGSFTILACTVQARCSDPDTVHDGSETRTRYQTEMTSAPATCQSEDQTRTCSDGSWSSWSGSYTFVACVVNCAGTADGESASRVAYESASVNAPASCSSETQSRTCNAGSWSSWSGSYTHTACTVQARCSTPDTVHGGSVSQVRYESASVQFPATCKSETQTQDCNNGAWSGWTGSYSSSSCQVVLPCSSPTAAHGESASRVRYESAIVSEPNSCDAQVQIRQCNNGAWTSWSGSHTYAACTVKARCSDPDTEHGVSEQRVRFQSASVNEPASCVSETQGRTCSDGSWSSWTGSYAIVSCTVKAQCSNPDTVHGGQQSKVWYESATVPHPATCETQSETRTRTCGNGVWSSWSGSYSSSSCEVVLPCTSPSAAHGESASQVRYESATVSAPNTCNAQMQIRHCNNGAWTSWSGSYTNADCEVLARCSGPDAAHGVSENRTRYQTGSVFAPSACQSEEQTRTCSNGSWADWSGLYSIAACTSVTPSTPQVVVEGQFDIQPSSTLVDAQGSVKVAALQAIRTMLARITGQPFENVYAGLQSSAGNVRRLGARRASSGSANVAYRITIPEDSSSTADSVQATADTVKSSLTALDNSQLTTELAYELRNQALNAEADAVQVVGFQAGVEKLQPPSTATAADSDTEEGGGSSAAVVAIPILLLICCCCGCAAFVFTVMFAPDKLPSKIKDALPESLKPEEDDDPPAPHDAWAEPLPPAVGPTPTTVTPLSPSTPSSTGTGTGTSTTEPIALKLIPTGTGTGTGTGTSTTEPVKKPAKPMKPAAPANTFEATNYMTLYSEADSEFDFFSGCSVLNEFIVELGNARGLPTKEVNDYKATVCKAFDAKMSAKEIAVKLWTSAETLDDIELCSHINAAIREDKEPLIGKAVGLCRLLNALVVKRRRAKKHAGKGGEIEDDGENKDLSGKKTYRGIGMPEKHFAFFQVGKVYRSNMFLASSFDANTAKSFMKDHTGDGCLPVLITIQFHKDLGCNHARYLEGITDVPGEMEVLMPPYSGFKVLKADFDKNGLSQMTIEAFFDNQLDLLKNVPLCPWH